jgi:hypothetical protein
VVEEVVPMRMIDVERRTFTRRAWCRGGRRATDAQIGGASLPVCPNCCKSGAALLAGEAEGGWWFVCLACDHLWDERQSGVFPRAHPAFAASSA